jgi:glycolate dehydrogenase FAD-binding subunit
VSADRETVRKDLLAACAETREGNGADAVGGADRISGVNGSQVAGGSQVTEAAGAYGSGRARGGPPSALVVPAFVAAPGSTEEAAAVMRVAAEHGLAVVVRGGGSRLSWGTPASRCDLVIDMSRMSGVVEHASGDLVARLQAGARMGDVAAVLAQAGQEIALDVPGDASVGGVVASGLAGPRRLRYGTPRDLLIGITIVRADGTIAKSGGKVVKNVAGYDLGKLFAGSAGTLGLITEATFRLHPRPAARAYVTTEYVAVSVACDAVAAAANSPLVSSAVELSRAEPGGPIRVGVLLEGSADGVQARSLRMADLLGKAEVAAEPPAWWAGAPEPGPGETLIRVSFWVSALGRVLDAIEAAAAKTGVAPAVEGSAGAGVLYVRVRPGEAADAPVPADGTLLTEGAVPAEGRVPAAGGPVMTSPVTGGPVTGGTAAALRWAECRAAAEFVGALREAVAGERGAVVVLTAPAAVREELAGHGGMTGTVPGLALMRAVKDQFDPGRLMAPGRFPEGI